MNGSDRTPWSRREFLARVAAAGGADGADWRFLNELKKELKG